VDTHCLSLYFQKAAAVFAVRENECPRLPSASLERAAALMAKYDDVPMNFADVALVALAEGTGVTEILTVDLRSLRTCHISSRKLFTIRL